MGLKQEVKRWRVLNDCSEVSQSSRWGHPRSGSLTLFWALPAQKLNCVSAPRDKKTQGKWIIPTRFLSLNKKPTVRAAKLVQSNALPYGNVYMGSQIIIKSLFCGPEIRAKGIKWVTSEKDIMEFWELDAPISRIIVIPAKKLEVQKNTFPICYSSWNQELPV